MSVSRVSTCSHSVEGRGSCSLLGSVSTSSWTGNSARPASFSRESSSEEERVSPHTVRTAC